MHFLLPCWEDLCYVATSLFFLCGYEQIIALFCWSILIHVIKGKYWVLGLDSFVHLLDDWTKGLISNPNNVSEWVSEWVRGFQILAMTPFGKTEQANNATLVHTLFGSDSLTLSLGPVGPCLCTLASRPAHRPPYTYLGPAGIVDFDGPWAYYIRPTEIRHLGSKSLNELPTI